MMTWIRPPMTSEIKSDHFPFRLKMLELMPPLTGIATKRMRKDEGRSTTSALFQVKHTFVSCDSPRLVQGSVCCIHILLLFIPVMHASNPHSAINNPITTKNQ